MQYVDPKTAIESSGLRCFFVAGFPSPWGQAAKAMMEHKGLDFIAAPQEGGGENAELVAWSGVNSAPVMAWNDEPPVNRWDDILLLLERLGPHRTLVPEDMHQRVQVFGLSHAICGPLGLGWNRRLEMVRPMMESGDPPPFARNLADKYGYNESDAALANTRVVALLEHLTATLAAQQARGSEYLVGDGLTAVDFYWAAFSNLVQIQSPEDCPLDPAVRPMFENTPAEVAAAVDPILIEHRDRIMRAHFKLPMEL